MLIRVGNYRGLWEIQAQNLVRMFLEMTPLRVKTEAFRESKIQHKVYEYVAFIAVEFGGLRV